MSILSFRSTRREVVVMDGQVSVPGSHVVVAQDSAHVARPRPYMGEWTVGHALALAQFAHLGQVDKLGVAYVKHPIEVQRLLLSSPYYLNMSDEDRLVAESAALLHDVIEDTPLDFNLLNQLGVPGRVSRVVTLLTRIPFGEPRHMRKKDENYYHDIARDPIALAVKRCDVAHNGQASRLRRLDEETRTRLVAKYAKANEMLDHYLEDR